MTFLLIFALISYSIDRPIKPKVISLSSDPYEIVVTWDHSTLCFEQYQFSQEIQWKKHTDSKWSSYIVEPSNIRYTINGLTAATLYDVRVRVLAMSLGSSPSKLASLFTEVNMRTSPGTLVYYCVQTVQSCPCLDVKMCFT